MRENASKLDFVQAVVPQVLTATNTSAAIDTAGANSVLVHIATGAIVSSGNFTPKLTECATSGGTYTDVAAVDLAANELPAVLAASSEYKVAYIGNKQFIKTVLTLNSGTSIAASVVVIKGHLSRQPA